jgi:hypothetical protein
MVATALYAGMRVKEINDLDLSYTPPLSSPWDPVQAAAQGWTTEARATVRLSGQLSLPENKLRRNEGKRRRLPDVDRVSHRA